MITASPIIPETWRGIFELLVVPVNYMYALHLHTLAMAWGADLWWMAILKRIFLFLPALSVLVGLWCSLMIVYTLIFRPHRLQLMGTLLVLWWDVARSVWLFWAGMGKFLMVVAGSCWGVIRLLTFGVLEMIREVFELP